MHSLDFYFENNFFITGTCNVKYVKFYDECKNPLIHSENLFLFSLFSIIVLFSKRFVNNILQYNYFSFSGFSFPEDSENVFQHCDKLSRTSESLFYHCDKLSGTSESLFYHYGKLSGTSVSLSYNITYIRNR
jgi:hypothetical protein